MSPIRLHPVLALCLVVPLLTACAQTQIFDSQSYLALCAEIPQSIVKRDIPKTKEETQSYAATVSAKTNSQIFRQLSPSFMEGQTKVYYIGETFEKTLQPRRSTVRMHANGFTIEHISQRVRLTLLGILDWNQDGDKEWLLACETQSKTKKPRTTTFYVIAPIPETSTEIVDGTLIAIKDCLAGVCTTRPTNNETVIRRDKESIPKTAMQEFRPGEQEITTPESTLPSQSEIRERPL
ncbi:MAG: hypothetical protein IJS54_00145 [Desulfovibrio sp.]|nr:hypothetical protein [Desulfovibrio sp.]